MRFFCWARWTTENTSRSNTNKKDALEFSVAIAKRLIHQVFAWQTGCSLAHGRILRKQFALATEKWTSNSELPDQNCKSLI